MSFFGPNNIEYHGDSGVTVHRMGTATVSMTGLQQITTVWKTRANNYNALPAIFSSHPVFGLLLLEKGDLSFDSGFCYYAATYAGLAFQYGGASETTPVYELTVGTAESPIATHPKFAQEIGGTVTNPKNGAVFEYQGDGTRRRWFDGAKGIKPTSNAGWVFVGFNHFVTANATTMNPYAGVSSFLEPQMTWRKMWNRKYTSDDVSDVGTIQTPPGNPPRLPAGANWLYMGLSATRRGGAQSMTQEWRSSGRRGWNPTLYKR